MMFKTSKNHYEAYPFANMGIFYQRSRIRYWTPGTLLRITESEKELRDTMFPDIWSGINEL